MSGPSVQAGIILIDLTIRNGDISVEIVEILEYLKLENKNIRLKIGISKILRKCQDPLCRLRIILRDLTIGLHGGLQRPPRQADHGENPNPKFQRASSHEQKERDGWSKSGEDAVPEVGRRVSWVAPASTSNPTGYPGDLKFLGRCGDIYSN